MTEQTDTTETKRPIGFAAMSKERLQEVASAGGKKAAHNITGHRYTPETAKTAGRLGGLKVAADREHMRAIARKGGAATRAMHAAKKAATVQ